MILDTIIATGDTVVKLCEELWEMSGRKPDSMVVWCCYAAPDALERIARCPVVEYVVVAKRAERCDEKGYLVHTNRDIGDKIYSGVSGQDGKVEPVVEGDIRSRVSSVGGAWFTGRERGPVEID